MNKQVHDVLACMQAGRFYDNIMCSGPELDRVKHYLQAMSGESPAQAGSSGQQPTYPVFPGLNYQEFHAPESMPATGQLRDSFALLQQEAAELLAAQDLLHYYHHGKQKEASPSFWGIGLMYYMGIAMDREGRYPETMRLLNSLPDCCLDYPWGDALFSLQKAHSHLQPHCSIDSLRVRCHLGIRIPEHCRIRVGSQQRGWQEGEVLYFEDSFEHEVWNDSDQDRLVFIVDFWHPDLSIIEREALTAGFRKPEVRRLFFRSRIDNTSADPDLLRSLEAEIDAADDEDLVQRFWH